MTTPKSETVLFRRQENNSRHGVGSRLHYSYGKTGRTESQESFVRNFCTTPVSLTQLNKPPNNSKIVRTLTDLLYSRCHEFSRTLKGTRS